MVSYVHMDALYGYGYIHMEALEASQALVSAAVASHTQNRKRCYC